MSAKIKPNRDENRQNLRDLIPLPAPFTVYIEQTRVCNIKCFYCIHATRDEKGGAFSELGYDIKHMPYDDGVKILNDLSEFPQGSIKRIVFSGLGEPLTNPCLPDFIKIASEKKIADRIEIITNGLLLTKELSEKIIASGVTNINISIQGISAEQYKTVCQRNIDFEKFIDNLKYLYSIRRNTKIYIKILDAALNSPDEKEKFYSLFGEMGDRLFVEHIIQMQQSHEDINELVDESLNFYGEQVDPKRNVCSTSFYFLQIGCDLDTFPCPVPGLPQTFSMGSAKKKSLLTIWNGAKRYSHLKTMLKLEKNSIEECRKCTCYNVVNDTSEYLDDVAPEILQRLERG